MVTNLVLKILHLINVINLRFLAYERQIEAEMPFLCLFFQAMPVIFPAKLAVER
jgi:hypothetical protein